uniref:Uncharacterized protein n=1 Tax=Arundo donax TaxID=35708 RepID=A0A0A9AH65_ARUDO
MMMLFFNDPIKNYVSLKHKIMVSTLKSFDEKLKSQLTSPVRSY